MSIKVGIIGATGYAGLEIARLLASHPEVELTALSSVSFEGQALSAVYPAVSGKLDMQLVGEDAVVAACDVVFASLPHGLSEPIAEKCAAANKILIDLGADFRLHQEDDYREWYGAGFADKNMHSRAVYAIPELFRDEIRGARLVANPGCYPTSVALGLAPLLKSCAIDADSIVIDSKSGVTGAGRGLSQGTHYPDCNENFAPYKIASHRHTPEIEQTLSTLLGKAVNVLFVPHLLPINRGILSTIYIKPLELPTEATLHQLYTDFYADERFVRVLPMGQCAAIKNVKYSNYCDISVHTDPRTGRVIIVSALDNMVKGAAGQAIQNMNIVCGLPEELGLDIVPPAF